ncbi:MAG TPA: hypothetical protein VNK43_09845 [Gemmatimonadales bacterium]|nr:hypothetical protein [Gemmatimonadales bacterium]
MVLIGIILLVALLIPILGIIVDSPIGRALARRLEGPETVPASLADLTKKVDLLESEVDDLHRIVQGLQEENAFLQRLLEDHAARPAVPPGARDRTALPPTAP